jgi:hypothetical protein
MLPIATPTRSTLILALSAGTLAFAPFAIAQAPVEPAPASAPAPAAAPAPAPGPAEAPAPAPTAAAPAAPTEFSAAALAIHAKVNELNLAMNSEQGRDASLPNGWDMIVAAHAAFEESLIGVIGPKDNWGNLQNWPAYAEIYDPGSTRASSPESRALNTNIAHQHLAALDKSGFFDRLDEAARSPRAVRPLPDKPGTWDGRLLAFQPPLMREARLLATIICAQMKLDLVKRDPAAAARRFEGGLAMARVFATQWSMFDRNTSDAITVQMLDIVRQHILESDPNPAFLDGVAAAMERQFSLIPPASFIISGQRLVAQDMLRWCYADTDKGDGVALPGPYLEAAELGGSNVDIFFQTDYAPRSQAQEKLSAFFDQADALINVPRFERGDRTAFLADAVDKAPEDLRMPALPIVAFIVQRAFAAADEFGTERDGMRVMVALERHRIRTGAYPADPSALVPAELAALPVDRFTGKPFIYRQLEKGQDRLAQSHPRIARERGYLLYTPGHDGKDNNGVTLESNAVIRALRPGQEGENKDFVINRLP